MSSETSRGRPVDKAKRAAILKAARTHFFTHGFESTRLEDVAEAAGVSKVTIYNRFGDKAGLLAACVTAQCERMQGEMGLDVDDGRSFADRLNAFGFALLAFLLSPEHVRFDRVMASEGLRSPEMGELFFQAGPARMHALLSSLLEDGRSAGLIAYDDANEAAEHVLSLWKGAADMHLRFSQPVATDRASLEKKVRSGTKRFLIAYAPSSPPSPERP